MSSQQIFPWSKLAVRHQNDVNDVIAYHLSSGQKMVTGEITDYQVPMMFFTD